MATGVGLKEPTVCAGLVLTITMPKREKSGAKTKSHSKTTIAPWNLRHKPPELIS